MTASVRAIVLLGFLAAQMAGSTSDACAQKQSEIDSQPMIGAAAPDFELRSIDGKTVGLADLRGKFVVIHFGTSW